MNPKDKASQRPEASEESNPSLEAVVSNLGNRLAQVGSVFKQLFGAERSPGELRPASEDDLSAALSAPAPLTGSDPARKLAASAAAKRSLPKAAELQERIAEDHAWIRQNLERRYRGRKMPAQPAESPDVEQIDEASIRARLLKIHGGRLPGRLGRQQSADPRGMAPFESGHVPVKPPASGDVQIVQSALSGADGRGSGSNPGGSPRPAGVAGSVKRVPPVTTSKPRASVVKPVPANLRKNPQPAATEASVASAEVAHPLEIAMAKSVFEQAAEPVVSDESSVPDLPVLQAVRQSIEERPQASAGRGAAPQLPEKPAPEVRSMRRDQDRPLKRGNRGDGVRRPISASISAPPPLQRTVQEKADPNLVAAPQMPAALEEKVNLPVAQSEASPETIDSSAEPGASALGAAPLLASGVEPEKFVKPRIVLRPTVAVVAASACAMAEPAPVEVPEEAASEPFVERDEVSAASRPLAPNWENYAPPLDLLQAPSGTNAPVDQETLVRNARLIEERLSDFRVKVAVHDACAGPVITRYEVEPAVGVRGAQVVNLMKDLARALGVTSIRVVETIPGKTYMGLELPNVQRQMIRLSEILSSGLFRDHPSKLAMALGKDITGEPVIADLAKAPHMLVAGTTGSGKSVGVNAMILSLLYRATPDEVRFVMIDPKMLELSVYDGIPHLLAPVVTDMKLAANALHWCVTEMERRYRLMSMLGVRNLAGFNQKVRDAEASGRPIYDPEPLVPESPTPLSALPFIVVVVDEFADLMMVAGKKIEELIARLAQKARAAGIHLILATQRPSVDVITGLIKANIPTRIAFQVSSKIDSRTILDQMGAETLLGQGDMLYLPPGTGYPQRVHGAFVADEEVHGLAEHLKRYGTPDYVDAVLGAPAGSEGDTGGAGPVEETDPLYDQAVAIVIETRRASISLVQRHLRIGYNRAARLVEQMEVAGLVSPMESNGSRSVLVPNH